MSMFSSFSVATDVVSPLLLCVLFHQLSLQPLHEVIFVPNGDLHDNVEIQQSQPLDADIEAQREAAPQSSVSFQTLAFAGGRRSYGTYASASNDWFLMTFQIKIK
ncbi:uncharacterized protein LOC114312995 isoform X1 [Camellia sinensis]|uniref:uncharacterized protein LOC114312995 isoform X1 n=1 Tax=Camellia sinensis TaxID=4442 RepID=UPI00103699B4|nr:uncharacterized protein LOC114312995 isoform X1 [Camellia sinensis]